MQTFTDLCVRARLGHAIARRGNRIKKLGTRNTQSAEIRTFSAIIQNAVDVVLPKAQCRAHTAHSCVGHRSSPLGCVGQHGIDIARIGSEF